MSELLCLPPSMQCSAPWAPPPPPPRRSAPVPRASGERRGRRVRRETPETEVGETMMTRKKPFFGLYWHIMYVLLLACFGVSSL